MSKTEQPKAESNCRSLALVEMTRLFLGNSFLGFFLSIVLMFRRVGFAGRVRVRRFWRECGAAEIAEAAVVLPILFMFIFGILQFARLYMIYSTMQRAALEGAQIAAGSVCATCGGPPTTAAIVATSMQPVFITAHIDYSPIAPPTAVPQLLACTLPGPGALVPCETGGSPNVCVQRNVVLGTAGSGSPVCGASVSFVYPYAFSLPSVTTTAPYVSRQTYTFEMPVQAQVQGEN
jgi:TadE-like protein